MKKLYTSISLLTVFTCLLFSSCETEENTYNPKLDTVFDLEFEFNKLSQTVEGIIKQIDTCVSEANFKRYYQSLEDTWPNINVLLDDGNRKINDESIVGGFRTKLEKLVLNLNDKKNKWENAAFSYNEIRLKDTRILFAFNTLKISLFKPNLKSRSTIKKLEDSYAILEFYGNIESLKYFENRIDFDYILNYGKDIKSIEKVFNFSRFTVITLELRFQQTFYNLYKDSISLSLNGLNPAVNNKELYNLYLKDKVDFSVSSKIYEYDELLFFGTNITEASRLLDAYESLNGYYLLLKNNFIAFVESKDSLKKYSLSIKDIPDPGSIFYPLYGDELPNFNELIYLAENTDSIVNWKKEYNNTEFNTHTLYIKYKLSDTITDFDDRVEVARLASKRKNLLNRFEIHLLEYRYFFQEERVNLEQNFNQDYLRWQLEYLLDLMGIKPDDDGIES